MSRDAPTPPHPASTVRVRPFAPQDWEIVLALADRLTIGIAPWLDPDAVLDAVRGWVRRSIDGMGPDRTVLVAEDENGGCVGFVSIERQVHWAGVVQAYVGEIVVAERAEGAGVGRALLAAVEEWAKQHGCATVALDTGAANERARGFYARLGFAEESIKLVKVLA